MTPNFKCSKWLSFSKYISDCLLRRSGEIKAFHSAMGWIMASKDIQVLIPKSITITLSGKINLQITIRRMILRWESTMVYTRLEPDYNHKYKEDREDLTIEKESNVTEAEIGWWALKKEGAEVGEYKQPMGADKESKFFLQFPKEAALLLWLCPVKLILDFWPQDCKRLTSISLF